MRRRLIPLSRVASVDSVKQAKKEKDERGRAMDIIMMAQHYYNNMAQFRKKRERCKRYIFGDQWSDIVTVDGKTMTEEQYIVEQGNIPLSNNLMIRCVRNVLGIYRGQTKEPVCIARDRDEQQYGETMSTVLQYNGQINQLKELYAKGMLEFLMSGLIVHKKSFGWRNERNDCWTDVVNPNNFFIDNNMRDFRGWDVSFIGEVHDVSFNDLCGEFSTSPKEYRELYEIYRRANVKENVVLNYENFGYKKQDITSFLYPTDPSQCRYIEVWKKERREIWRCHDPNDGSLFKVKPQDYTELVELENAKRLQEGAEFGIPREEIPLIKAEWAVETYWRYYYLSPFGDILKEGESEYKHKSHPYVFRMFPFIDGEIHPFVADFIDQQRYTNRLITMYDWIMRSSAKGVLMFPEELLPEGVDLNDITDRWTRFDGVILYSAKPGVEMPRQIATNSTNIGISELLNLQLKLFDDISGVNGALQGKPGFSGMSASLYAQQAQNAATSLLDLLESFSMFVVDAAYKDIKNIQQNYDLKRIRNIVGKKSVVMYDPDVEYDLSIEESTTTPAHRTFANELLMELFRAQAINVKQLLENGNFPFADNLLQSIKAEEEKMAQGQAEGLPPEVMQQAQQGADMNAVNRAQQMLRGRNVLSGRGAV